MTGGIRRFAGTKANVRLLLVVTAALAVLLATRCGGSGHPAVVGGGVSGALQAVSDSPAARQYFEWGDVQAQVKLGGIPASALVAGPGHLNQHWLRIIGIGAGPIVPQATTAASQLKLNAFAASAAITIGLPPNDAFRVDGPGIDGTSVAAALRRAGAKQQGDFLAIPPGLTNPVSVLMPGVSRASASSHTVAFGFGPTRAALSAVQGGGATLGDQPAYQAAANCLGNVMWAAIAPPHTFGAEAGPELIAIGGRRPANASSAAVEVLCAIDHESAVADSHVRALRRMLGPSGLLPTIDEPTSKVVADASVGRADSSGLQVARAVLTLRSSVPAGFLYEEFSNRQLALFLATTCPGQQILGRTATPQQIQSVCQRLGLPTGP